MRLLISLLILWIIVTFALIPLVKSFRRARKYTKSYIEKQFEEDTEGDNKNELND